MSACPTCGFPKWRPTGHADWCWTANPSLPNLDGCHAIVTNDEYLPMQPCLQRTGWTCDPMWPKHQDCTEANRAGFFKPEWMP